MKCWECRKKISSAYRVCYFEYHIEKGMSKEKYRNVCKECYSKLKFDGTFINVDKITQRSLKEVNK